MKSNVAWVQDGPVTWCYYQEVVMRAVVVLVRKLYCTATGNLELPSNGE